RERIAGEQQTSAFRRLEDMLLGNADVRGRQNADVLSRGGRRVGYADVFVEAPEEPSLTQRSTASSLFRGEQERRLSLDPAKEVFQQGIEEQGVRIVRTAMMERDQVIRGQMPRELDDQRGQEIGGAPRGERPLLFQHFEEQKCLLGEICPG